MMPLCCYNAAMSQAPHQDPPPPHPTPDDPFDLQPVQPAKERELTAEIVTISMIVAGLVLLGVGAMFWYRDNRPASPPPPAPTATYTLAAATEQAVATHTPVPASTQSTAIAARPTVTRRAVRSPTRTAVSAAPTDKPTGTPLPSIALPFISGGTSTPAASPGSLDVHLPVVSSDQQFDEATLTPTQPTTPLDTPTPVTQIVSLPILSQQEAPPTPTDTPVPPSATPDPNSTIPAPPTNAGMTVTPTAAGITTGTPAGTPLVTPATTPSVTPSAIPTGLPYFDDDMAAKMDANGVFYIGPSAVYSATDQLNAGTEIRLHGRDRTGEWVYACCVDDDDQDEEDDDRAWVRQAFVRIEGNQLDGGQNGEDEDGIDRNDARWLPVVSTRPDLRLLPTVTPPPEGDYALFRYTPDNRGFLSSLPNLSNAAKLWANEPEAGGELVSPLVVAGSYVYAGSGDSHIYAWDRVNGSQRARKQLNAPVYVAPATDDGLIYVADNAGWLYALQDPINGDPVWSIDLGGPPVSGINVYSHTLFVNLSGQLLVIDGEEGDILNGIGVSAAPSYPAIGGQLLYLISDSVKAYDVLTLIEEGTVDLIWERPGIPAGSVPPLYTSHGVESLAELYVAGANNRIYSLDANTGRENWNDDSREDSITSLALNDTTLFIAGDNYIKARNREAPNEGVDPLLWRTSVAGSVLGGLLVDQRYVIAFLQSGNILILDAATGDSLGNYATYPANPGSAGAVSFPYVYAPGRDGKLYGYQQSP